MRRELLDLGERDPLTRQQALDAIRVAAPITPGEEELAMDLAAILVRGRGNMHHAPRLLLTRIRPDEHRHQLARVEAIGLRPPLAAIDFNARRIDDAVAMPRCPRSRWSQNPSRPAYRYSRGDR
jgi:hypothetical protein